MKTLTLALMAFIFVACKGSGEGSGQSVFDPEKKLGPITTSHYAYVANFDDDTIDVKEVNKTSYELDNVEVQATCDRPNMLAVHPNEKFLFVTCSGDNSVVVYAINQQDGSLSEIEEKTSVGTYPHGIAVSGDGKYLYVSNESDAEVASFSIASDGTLTAISTIASGGAPHDVKVIGDFVYVANYSISSNSVHVYSIQSNGALSFVEEEPAGTSPRILYSLGNHLLAVNRASDNVSVFSRDPISGELTHVEDEIVGDSPTSVTSIGSNVYVSNSADNTVSVFTYDSSTGDLTLQGTSNVGNKPVHLIGIPALSMLISVNETGGDVHGYPKLDNGYLTNTPESTFVGNKPTHGVYLSVSN